MNRSTNKDHRVKSTLLIIALLAMSLVAGFTVPTATENIAAATAHVKSPGTVAPRDAVTVWNRKAASLVVSASPTPAIAPIRQGRAMAIVQVAVHDAVNGITGKYATYLSPGAPAENASPEAAAIAAAHRVLWDMYGQNPNQAPGIQQLFYQTLADHGLSEFDPGVAYGRAAAEAVLALRSTDGAVPQASCPYTPTGAGTPGVFVPLSNQTALLACWGSVAPWVMRSGSQFRPEPPPALTSEEYARDYNEVKEIGASNSTSRTLEQTRTATFWLASPVTIWNQVMDQAAEARGLDLSATARLYALVYVAAADASIACWEAKYYYNFWRPQAAIRNGHLDGNDQTTENLAWAPLHNTPAHPDFTSGHSSNSSAIAMILGLELGDAPGIMLTSTVPAPGNTTITKQWASFSEAVDEVIDARVYSGIHFRTANLAGARTGRQAARFAISHVLQPCGKGKAKCD